jgi:hypothetical protein
MSFTSFVLRTSTSRCSTAAPLARAWLLSAALLAPAAAAQTSVFSPVVTAVPQPYVVSPFTPNCAEVYHLYLPDTGDHDKPEDGWPVVIHLNLGGFAVTHDIPQIDVDAVGGGTNAVQRRLGRFLQAGIAVVTAQATPSLVIDSAGATAWDNMCTGPISPPTVMAPIPGHGMFHPPGMVSEDVSFAPYDDPDYAMPEKDAVMLIQHVKHHAAQTEDPTPSTVPEALTLLDHENVVVEGTSAAAMSLMWAVFGPDRSGEAPFSAGSGQFDVDSRPKAAILNEGAVWYPIFDDDFGTSACDPDFPGTYTSHFGVAPSGSCPTCGGHSETPASSMGAASMLEKIASSALTYEEAADPPLEVYMVYKETSVCEDYVNNGSCSSPFTSICYTGQTLDCNLHPAWSGYAWMEDHAATTRLVIATCEALEQRNGVSGVVSIIGDDTLDVEKALTLDMIAWLLGVFASADLPDPADASPWVTIAQGPKSGIPCATVSVPGAGSVTPVLTGTGSLVAGQYFKIELTDALPNADGALFYGADATFAPFKGGLAVPPLVLFLPITVDGSGDWDIDGNWPSNIPYGTLGYYQAWIEDPAAPHDFSGSNGLISIAQ